VEGGPLPLLEAMAAGVPVLSPRFGYAADLLDYEQIYDDLEGLRARLEEFTAAGIFHHQLVHSWTWRDYAAEYALVIGRLIGESVDLYPERGMSRYAQLLDVIDEVKPDGIVEIGTWNGHSAARMIQAAAKTTPIEDVVYQGFDLFEGMTGEQFRRELSKHGHVERVVEKKLEATGAHIELVAGDTKLTLYHNLLFDDQLECPDFYFVDGGHSEATIKSDAKAVFDSMQPGAVAIFDDYYHEGKPEGVGCNKVIDELDREQYQVTFLPALTHADDGRVIGMVRVERRKVNHAELHLSMPEASYDGTISDIRPGVWHTFSALPQVSGANAPGAAVN
jgi:predicted O-methyltransferase YrrM